MKYLQMNIYFKLPDGFEGGENDAIEELLKYRRSEKNHKTDFEFDPSKTIYENWWDMIHTTDRVLFGELDYGELNRKLNEWVSFISTEDKSICKAKK